MTAAPRIISILAVGRGGQQKDPQEASQDRPGKQPHQVGSIDLSNGSGHQQDAESHLQNGFDRYDELEGKEEDQQGNAQQGSSEPGKRSEEKGKQHDGLGSQQGRIHGIAGSEPSSTKQLLTYTTNRELSPLPSSLSPL